MCFLCLSPLLTHFINFLFSRVFLENYVFSWRCCVFFFISCYMCPCIDICLSSAAVSFSTFTEFLWVFPIGRGFLLWAGAGLFGYGTLASVLDGLSSVISYSSLAIILFSAVMVKLVASTEAVYSGMGRYCCKWECFLSDC